MNTTKKFIAVSAALLASGARLSAQDVSSSPNYRLTQESVTPTFAVPPVVAKVNGVDITVNQFWSRILANAGSAVLTSLVDEILIEQEAEKVKLISDKKIGLKGVEKEVDKRAADLKKQFKDEQNFQAQLANAGLNLDAVKKQIRMDILKEKLLENKIKVTPADAKKFFEENRQQLAVPEQVRVAHILVSTEQEARDLALSLKVGANFELLAREKSQDAATRERGGELGSFAKGMLIPQLEQKAFSLSAGGTDIVQTPMGFHIIKVLGRTAAKAAIWDKETQANVGRILRQAKFNQEYPAYIQALRGKSDIQVFLNK